MDSMAISSMARKKKSARLHPFFKSRKDLPSQCAYINSCMDHGRERQ
jgi:hypothetical protein